MQKRERKEKKITLEPVMNQVKICKMFVFLEFFFFLTFQPITNLPSCN